MLIQNLTNLKNQLICKKDDLLEIQFNYRNQVDDKIPFQVLSTNTLPFYLAVSHLFF